MTAAAPSPCEALATALPLITVLVLRQENMAQRGTSLDSEQDVPSLGSMSVRPRAHRSRGVGGWTLIAQSHSRSVGEWLGLDSACLGSNPDCPFQLCGSR